MSDTQQSRATFCSTKSWVWHGPKSNTATMHITGVIEQLSINQLTTIIRSSTWRSFQEPTSELPWKSLDYEGRGEPREVRTQPRIGRLPANDSAICRRRNSTTATIILRAKHCRHSAWCACISYAKSDVIFYPLLMFTCISKQTYMQNRHQSTNQLQGIWNTFLI